MTLDVYADLFDDDFRCGFESPQSGTQFLDCGQNLGKRGSQNIRIAKTLVNTGVYKGLESGTGGLAASRFAPRTRSNKNTCGESAEPPRTRFLVDHSRIASKLQLCAFVPPVPPTKRAPPLGAFLLAGQSNNYLAF